MAGLLELVEQVRIALESKVGGGAIDLVRTHTGLSNGEAAEWLVSELGIPIEAKRQPQQRRRIVATYDYRDEAGELLFQVVRYEPKDFRQRRPDGQGGWTWRVTGVRQVPYRLFELRANAVEDPVLIVEGEKDVDCLASLGFVATCNAGGANKWPDELSRYFRGLAVCILCDNDMPAAAMRRGSQRPCTASPTACASSISPVCRKVATCRTGSTAEAMPGDSSRCVRRHHFGSPVPLIVLRRSRQRAGC